MLGIKSVKNNQQLIKELQDTIVSSIPNPVVSA